MFAERGLDVSLDDVAPIMRRAIVAIEDKRFYDAKIKTATFFFERILPQATASFLAIKAGKKSLKGDERKAFMSDCLKG